MSERLVLERLVTDRLRLSSWRSDQAADAHRLWGSPDVMRWVGPPHESLARSAAALEAARDAERRHGVCLWRVERRADGTFLGACGFHLYDGPGSQRPGERWLELAYHLLPAAWGKGYAREAARACLDWARTTQAATQVVAFAHRDHLRSRRVLAAIGLCPRDAGEPADEEIEHRLTWS